MAPIPRSPATSLPARVTALAIAAALLAAATPADAGCPPMPRALCRDFGQSSLAIDGSGHFNWRAARGPAASLDDFGADPAASSCLLCAWDDRGLVVAADIPVCFESALPIESFRRND